MKLFEGLSAGHLAGILLLIALSIWLFVPEGDLLRDLMPASLVGSMLIGIIDWQDRKATRELSRQLQLDHERLTLGATTHMAIKAFDEFVQFCEEYLKEVNSTLHLLETEGTTKKALEAASKLYSIREQRALWVTSEVHEHLEQFEYVLRKLGANAHAYDQVVDGLFNRGNLEGIVDRMQDAFGRLLGFEGDAKPSPAQKAVAISEIKRMLRSQIGTESIAELRQSTVTKALVSEQ